MKVCEHKWVGVGCKDCVIDSLEAQVKELKDENSKLTADLDFYVKETDELQKQNKLKDKEIERLKNGKD